LSAGVISGDEPYKVAETQSVMGMGHYRLYYINSKSCMKGGEGGGEREREYVEHN
jgi:hypothetical protein